MTGYGEATVENKTCYLYVAIKTLNSKYLDIQFNLPKTLITQEAIWRKLFSQHLQRGKVTLEITYLPKTTPLKELINETSIKACYHTLSRIAQELNATTDLLYCALHTAKNTIHTTPQTLSPSQLLPIHQVVEKALKQCVISRQIEAKQLGEQITGCLNTLGTKLIQIDEQTPKRNLALRTKLNEKIALREPTSQLDANRWEQEILYYLEKLDIEEEKTRLKSHITYFEQTLEQKGVIGKKLTFIAQEIGRELNTIASKAQDTLLQHLTVDMKQAIEQIREQLQNLV